MFLMNGQYPTNPQKGDLAIDPPYCTYTMPNTLCYYDGITWNPLVKAHTLSMLEERIRKIELEMAQERAIIESNPSVKEAYQNYKFLSNMVKDSK